MSSQRQLQLVLVAYHTPAAEVKRLSSCLNCLDPSIGYAIVVNKHRPGDPIEALAPRADLFLTTSRNLGYGRAVNWAASALADQATQHGVPPAPWLAALNTDLSWAEGSFEALLDWLSREPNVVLAVPQIRNPAGDVQELCKTDPSIMALLSRRFVPSWLKPVWLQRLDRHYVMAGSNLDSVFDVEYLSGCCMVVRYSAFELVGGFDERFFLYLEDADLTRSLRKHGRCIHVPVIQITHVWGRANHRSLWLTAVNLVSAWLYFRKWGWRLR
jgi:GT2 family glycosyltransferase